MCGGEGACEKDGGDQMCGGEGDVKRTGGSNVYGGEGACEKDEGRGGLASYPGHLGGEKRPGIDCLRMRDQFRYISVKF